MNNKKEDMMKIEKLYKNLVGMYEENGASAVFDYAKKNGSQFESNFDLCAPCENETPTIKGDDCCAVCGSVRD